MDCCAGSSTVSACCCPKNEVRAITHSWKFREYSGSVLCRISNRFRMKYRVAPGLYSLGAPTPESPVLVTANYKLTFDVLRRDSAGLNAWILVLDTKGINVWCAAGKGSFGTVELVRRVGSERLAEKVSHRKLIVPQLGAPGVSAHQVRKETGFSVAYGPVRSRDIRAFLESGKGAVTGMRTVDFGITDRAVLIPMELEAVLRKTLIPILVIGAVMGLELQGIIFQRMAMQTLPIVAALFAAIIAGTVVHPILLPIFPIRAFTLQGLILGIVAALLFHLSGLATASVYLTAAVWTGIPAISSYLAFNFTGCTPFTNRSGVKKELRFSVPYYAVSGAVTGVLLVLHKLSLEGLL